ncbi:uncharacterized protein LOC117104427 [Anneissia japonica]|uniref:uncharacterized protein LOC117104427 n=1 Tax=Anneissia japonica TaxID=1529436 RepID=UPI0014259541|nr:uncharacterized protein LOC117104427 [Anneissia japonica]
MAEEIKANKTIRRMRKDILTKNIRALKCLVAQQDYPEAEAQERLQELHTIFVSIADAHSDLIVLIEDKEDFRFEEEWMSQCVEEFMPEISEIHAMLEKNEMATVRTIKMDLAIDDASTLRFIQRMIEKSGDNDDVIRWLETVNTVGSTGCELPVKLIECSADGIWKIKFETINTVVPALPLLSNIRHVDNQKRDDDALRYLNSVKQSEIDIKVMEIAITEWRSAREKLVNQLQEIAVKIRKHKRNTHIVRIVSASTSTAGGLACLSVGILGLLSVYTTPLGIITLVGASVGAIGGVASGGAFIASLILSSQGTKEANALIKKDNVTFEYLKEVQQKYTDSLKIHMAAAKRIDKVVLEFKKTSDGSISVMIKVGRSISKTISFVKSVNTEIKSIDGKIISVLSITTLRGKVVITLLQSTTRLDKT